MKREFLNKAVSLTAALTIGCTNLIGTGLNLTASANEPETETTAEEVSTELIPVIVKVSGDAVLATPEGIEQGDEFLNTEQAVQMSDALKNTQAYVQNEIRQIYPELEVGYSYSVLYNGFSCEIPENLIEQVKALPYVEAVCKVQKTAVPQMASASELGGYPAYYDATGCSGEGQVIAVIDSELNINHPMFSALDESIEVKLTEEDIAEIASTIGFNVDIDPALAYRSSKLPYVIDYYDYDPYEAVGMSDYFPTEYHGTHVAGIAAGNAFTDENGKTYSGIAKDAQIVFMAAGNSEGNIDGAASLAALEDAVKLHADVINMSFANGNDATLREVCDAAINAGITICAAAGNEDNGKSLGEIPTPDNPDTNQLGNGYAGTLTVASATNTYTEHNKAFQVGDDLIMYLGTSRTTDDGTVHFLSDELSGEYEYVYCGTGTQEEIAQQDVAGKIVLVTKEGSSLYVQDKAVFAQEAGAVGIISAVREDEELWAGIVDNALPSAIISHADLQKMIQAENKVLTFTDQTIDVDVATAVSDYTSWGVKSNLELCPDIMGIGGHVESANYSDGVSPMNGTSMASPYVAGCAAVLNEYLTKKGVELEGAEKLRYMRNLLMTSAFPYEEDGMFVTPRRQGAGMISLNNLIADKVILTGNEGESKIQLYDNVGDAFSFDLNLTNISEEDVDFTSARLVLTTDSTKFDEKNQTDVISGQQILNCSYDLGSLLHIGAGESRTETVSVALDANQTAAIQEIFTNGFFVEGYLLLEGAENCCDISVPLLGFHGDWAKVPVLDEEDIAITTMGNGQAINAGYSLAQLSALLKDIIPEIPEEELNAADYNIHDLVQKYATEEQKNALDALKTDTYYISPNGDGLADNIGAEITLKRYGIFSGMNIYNSDGELITSGQEYEISTKNTFFGEAFDLLNGQEDGVYTAQNIGYINYPSSIENPQVKEFQFIVDTKAPELESELIEQDGRQILKVTATDTNLDGVYISGLKGNQEELDLQSLGLTGVYAKEYLMNNNGTMLNHAYNSSALPPIGKMLLTETTDTDLNYINFSDMIVAEPDENGVFTFEYDVTDFTSYTFTVMDRAYNIANLESAALPAESISDGIYMYDNGLICFANGKMSMTSFKDGSFTESSYTLENGVLSLEDKQILLEQVNEVKYRMKTDDETITLRYYREGTLNDYHFYTYDQLEKRVKDIAINLYGYEDAAAEISMNNGVVTASCTCVYEGESYWMGDFTFDIFTGEVISEEGNGIFKNYLSPITFEDFDLNKIMVIDGLSQNEIYYANFNSGKAFKQTDGTEVPISYELNNTDLKFIIDGEEIVFTDYAFYRGYYMTLTKETTEGEELQVASAIPYYGIADEFYFYSNTQLKEMALDFYEAQNGTRPENVEVTINEYGGITLQMTETEIYTIDALTGKGYNQDGEEIDLTSALPPMEDPFKSGTWFAYAIYEGEYFIFDGNQGGQIVPIDGTESIDFTYQMTSTGISLTTGDNTTVYEISLEEDGNIRMMNTDDYSSMLMTKLNDSTETVECYTVQELVDMAKAYAPEETQSAHTYINPNGTISIYLIDENDEAVESYTVSIETAEGTDIGGNPVDLKEAIVVPDVPELPENAYSLDKLCDMAKKDYKKKNGTAPANADAKINKDGSVSIELTDKNGSVIDTYTVDAVSGEGTNSKGETVNLPQTGNNAPDTVAKASASAFLTFAGLLAVLKSGIFRRKREND